MQTGCLATFTCMCTNCIDELISLSDQLASSILRLQSRNSFRLIRQQTLSVVVLVPFADSLVFRDSRVNGISTRKRITEAKQEYGFPRQKFLIYTGKCLDDNFFRNTFRYVQLNLNLFKLQRHF